MIRKKESLSDRRWQQHELKTIDDDITSKSRIISFPKEKSLVFFYFERNVI